MLTCHLCFLHIGSFQCYAYAAQSNSDWSSITLPIMLEPNWLIPDNIQKASSHFHLPHLVPLVLLAQAFIG